MWISKDAEDKESLMERYIGPYGVMQKTNTRLTETYAPLARTRPQASASLRKLEQLDADDLDMMFDDYEWDEQVKATKQNKPTANGPKPDDDARIMSLLKTREIMSRRPTQVIVPLAEQVKATAQKSKTPSPHQAAANTLKPNSQIDSGTSGDDSRIISILREREKTPRRSVLMILPSDEQVANIASVVKASGQTSRRSPQVTFPSEPFMTIVQKMSIQDDLTAVTPVSPLPTLSNSPAASPLRCPYSYHYRAPGLPPGAGPPLTMFSRTTSTTDLQLANELEKLQRQSRRDNASEFGAGGNRQDQSLASRERLPSDTRFETETASLEGQMTTAPPTPVHSVDLTWDKDEGQYSSSLMSEDIYQELSLLYSKLAAISNPEDELINSKLTGAERQATLFVKSPELYPESNFKYSAISNLSDELIIAKLAAAERLATKSTEIYPKSDARFTTVSNFNDWENLQSRVQCKPIKITMMTKTPVKPRKPILITVKTELVKFIS